MEQPFHPGQFSNQGGQYQDRGPRRDVHGNTGSRDPQRPSGNARNGNVRNGNVAAPKGPRNAPRGGGPGRGNTRGNPGGGRRGGR